MPAKENGPQISLSEEVRRTDFPPNFVFGVATSAHQIEGASKEGGKGPSIWDAYAQIEGNIFDGSNADVATDHYHRYEEDTELIAKLGFGAYRFSISWPRIYPDDSGKVNEEGITFYNNLINALIEKGIQPYVTLYHWDHPLYLEESSGGWLDKGMVEQFATYADTCFARFGDRVKKWLTINEPLQCVVNGYDTGFFAPGRREKASTEPYLAAHHQLLAHAAAVSVYKNKYKEQQEGEIGLVLDCEWGEAISDKSEDQSAAARRMEFQLGWFLDPLYHGDYPEVMRNKLGDQLPKFSQEDIELFKQPMDFLGLNHYTTRYIAHATDSSEEGYYYKAQDVDRIAQGKDGTPIGKQAASSWLYVVPWGIEKTIKYISQRYNNIPIYVTESGMDDEDNHTCSLHEMLDDNLRLSYYKTYLASVAQAIKEGADVRGYFAWSLLDNYEWCSGYTKRFGLVYVDFKNGLTRHPKSSANWFARFLKGNEKEEQ